MMHCRITTLLILMLGAGCLTAYGWLQNPSFEDPEDPTDLLSDRAMYWGRWGNWMNRETGWTPAYTGKCMVGYHHWRIKEEDDSGIYQDVAGTPVGATCSFKVQAFKDTDTDAKRVEIRLEPLGGGQPLASANYRMLDLPDNRWREISVTGVSPASGVRVLILVEPKQEGKRQGAVKFDQAVLTTAE